MDRKDKNSGILLVGMLAVVTLASAVGVTQGMRTLEAWRTGLASMPIEPSPIPVPPAIDVDDAAAAPPAAAVSSHAATPAHNRVRICALGGVAGTGVAMLAGPTEMAELIAGALSVPVSLPFVAAVLGGGFVTGCAVGATVAPIIR